MSERRADYLPEAIRERLIHDPRVAEQDLRVEVQERRVMPGGNVSSPQLKQRITEVAKESLPDYEVINETTEPARRRSSAPASSIFTIVPTFCSWRVT